MFDACADAFAYGGVYGGYLGCNEAYAAGLGLQPHPDYHKAKLLFGDIDPSACQDEFEFGKEPAAAEAWALGPDQANADRILASRDLADLVIMAPG